MQSKLLTLALSAFALTIVTQRVVGGTSPTPSFGYVRMWNMLPAASGTFELRRMPVTASDASIASATSYTYSSYTELPVAKYQLVVVKAGTQVPIKTLAVEVKPETFFTVVIAPQGSGLNVEFTDDTADPKATAGALTLRNYFPGTVLRVSSGGQPIADALAYGQSHVVKDLPLAKFPLTVETKLPDGKPAQSTLDVDLQSSSRATLLVIPDSYGRFRPRLTMDGHN